MADDLAFAMARHLGSKEDKEEFEQASLIAQIFSGTMFTALVVYLVFSNSTRLSYIQKASLEKRLNTCCQLNTIVAALSAFLNFFQLTEVDNWLLPGQRSMVVDLARPIEWILTCPVMQLSLVIMGGSRIPEYRRLLMPGSSALVLFFGSCTLFADQPYTFIIYGVGLCIHLSAMYFNRLQIIEHSNGVEGLFEGDSEFRKATLILMFTWIPFPAWYILSPEGIGYVDSIAVVQMGWAFLNITSKFSLIFYMQRIKDNYCNRLKVKREMKGALANAYYTDEDDEEHVGQISGELSACVVETMGDLGMAYNVERFLALLRVSGIYTLDDLDKLKSKEECTRMQLPLDLVSAIQRKHKVWALEMVDDAERGLEAGEKHYQMPNTNSAWGRSNAKKKNNAGEGLFLSPSSVVPCDAIALQPNQPMNAEFSSDVMHKQASKQTIAFGSEALTEYKSGTGQDEELLKQRLKPLERKMEHLEDKMSDKFDLIMQTLQKQMEQTQQSQSLVEAKVEVALSRQHQGEMGRALHRIEASSQDGAVPHSAAQAVEQSLEVVTKQMEQCQESNKGALTRLGGSITQMMDGWAQHTIQESKAVAFTLQTKMAQLEESQSKKMADVEEHITTRLHKIITDGLDNLRTTTTQQTRTSFEQLQCSIETTKTINIDESHKLEQKLGQFVKELSLDFSKNVELGMGVVGNSLRAQLDGMQASAMVNNNRTESSILDKVDTSLNGIQQNLMQGLLQQSLQLQSQAQAQTQKQMDKSTEKITGMLESAKMDIQSQRKDTDNLSSAIRDVSGGTEEVMGKLLTLYDHLGVNDCDIDRRVASPSGRRLQARGGGGTSGDYFNRQNSSGSRR